MDVIPLSPYERLRPLRESFEKRLCTFTTSSYWHTSKASEYIEMKDLADDGFYYTGLDDKVQCTHCGGILSG